MSRYLLDTLRAKVADELGLQNWFHIDQAQRLIKTTSALRALMERSQAKHSFKLAPVEISSYIVHERSYVRRLGQGNVAAHSGEEDDIEK